MLEIRFSEPNGLELSGTVDELQAVRKGVFELIKKDASQIAFDCDGSVNPTPYDHALLKLMIWKNQFPTESINA